MRETSASASDIEPPLRPAIILGVGFGALLDGVVLHHILQWHHLLSSRYPVTSLSNLQLNTLLDGLFDAAAVSVLVVGLALLWMDRSAAAAWRARRLAGGVLAGWGGFNIAEGIVDHHVLGLHHVREVAQPLLWDLGFLGVSALILIAGLALLRSARATAG